MFVLAEDFAWAPKGHEIAAEQFKLPFAASPTPIDIKTLPLLKKTESASQVVVSGADFEVRFDRAASAFVGHYRSTAREQFVPYVSPQENGYKTDVRWVALLDLSFSALRYTIEDLTQEKRGSRHPVDLEERDFVEVNIDYKQTGVGGEDSWGARPYPQYTLFPQDYSYRFRIRPLLPGDDPMRLSKQRFALD